MQKLSHNYTSARRGNMCGLDFCSKLFLGGLFGRIKNDYEVIPNETGSVSSLHENGRPLTYHSAEYNDNNVLSVELGVDYEINNYQEPQSTYENPSDYINNLNEPHLTNHELINHLKNLRELITNDTLKWIEEFREVGIQKLVIRLKESQKREDRYIIETECIKCLCAIMNNTDGIKLVFACVNVLPALAESLNIHRQSAMIEAVKILAAITLLPGGFDKVMEAITMAGETSSKSRFAPIVDGIKIGDIPLKIACMQLINAIISAPDDLDSRMHLRNEFMRSVLHIFLEDLKCVEDDLIKIQIKAFKKCSKDDYEEFNKSSSS